MAVSPRELLRLFRRDGGQLKHEIVEGMPIADSGLVTLSTILMLASVGGKNDDGSRWELVGGKTYQVQSHKADEFIINGWATGELSRFYSAGEIEELRSRTQNINFKGEDA